MRYCLFILILFCGILTFSQNEDKYEVLIEVKSNENGKSIEGAKVQIKGYEETQTDPKGKAWFPEVVKGSYQIEVDAPGFENYLHPFQFKVTGYEDNLTINLVPLPDNSFSVKGRVIEAKSKNYIDSAEVYLIIGPIEKTVYTNKWGFFQILFDENEIAKEKEFNLSIAKKGYEQTPTYKNGFYTNHVEVPNFELEKKTIKKDTSLTQLGISSSPLLSIKISPEAGFFLNENDAQVQGTSAIALKWNFSKKKKISIEMGWLLPIQLTAQNRYETLIGQQRKAETLYQINNLGFLGFTYYLIPFNNEQISPFISVQSFLALQLPKPPIISNNNHEEDLNSFFKLIPRLSGGLCIIRKNFEIEPFISISYLNLKSQNFVFNYFGRANSVLINDLIIQLTAGIGFSLVAIKK